ncbi:MAG: hypothetical protein GF388_00065 [Candidatus Aegiribacteria sp.]|nr:hypothetical protein [Candidatus Aegiribacteria sp.]
MWNRFEFLNSSLKDEIRTKTKRLLIGWAIWSVLVLALFAGFWLWGGMPHGPDGVFRTWAMMIVISVIAPPVVWLIGKAIIG